MSSMRRLRGLLFCIVWLTCLTVATCCTFPAALIAEEGDAQQGSVAAQAPAEVAPTTNEAQPTTAVQATSAVQVASAAQPAAGLGLDKLARCWDDVVTAIAAHDLRKANDLLIELNKLKMESGFDALDSYSLVLVAHGIDAQRAADKDSATFFANKALQLSPDSPLVLLRSLPLVQYTRVASPFSQVMRIFLKVWHHPYALLALMRYLTYPLLVAFTAGLYIVLLICLTLHVADLLRGFATKLSLPLGGFIAPLIALVVLVVPLWGGPLWSVTVWSLLLWLFVPQRRWLCLYTGVTVALWGMLIPIRENVSLWLDDPGIQTLFQVSSKPLGQSDRKRLEDLMVQRPDDAFVAYTYGQLLRRNGEFKAASQAFARAEGLLGLQGWTKAQQGSIAFLQGNAKEADKLYAEAEGLGVTSTEFYFNYSKIKFELLDTAASRDLYTKALNKNTVLTQALKEREDLLGLTHNHAIAEIELPFYRLTSSALVPYPQTQINGDRLAAMMMRWCSPIGLGIAGLFLLLLFCLDRKQRSRRQQKIFSAYEAPTVLLSCIRLTPGGALLMAGRSGLCLFLLSIFILMLMPIVEWPHENRGIWELMPNLFPYYICIVMLYSLAVVYIGFLQEGRR